MAKYRVAIQRIEDKPLEFANVMLVSDLDIEEIKQRIIRSLSKAYDSWQREFMQYLEQRNRKAQLKAFIESDLFDSEAVGHDISKEEYLENEMFFARRGL